MRAARRRTARSPSHARAGLRASPSARVRVPGWTVSRARRNASRQPAFPPPVVLGLAEALAPAAGDAEVELLHVLVLAERGGRALHHHAAVLEDVAEVREAQRDHRVLLG